MRVFQNDTHNRRDEYKMSNQSQDRPEGHSTNSTGQSLTDENQLDNHYRLAKREYDACISAVGIQKSWRVLDAGCGNGVFLPHIAAMVGETGRVVAMDHAPESIAAVERRIRDFGLPNNIETKVSSVTELAFEDASFDCVWCANVTQYLTEAELDKAVSEFGRVVKPGGLVAIKEADVALCQFHPVDTRLFWRLFDAAAAMGGTQVIGVMRGWGLSKWMRRHGIEVIKRETTLIERVAPLEPFAITFLGGILGWLASFADRLPLSNSDKAEWHMIQESVEKILQDPDACYQEAFTLTVGVRKP
jgi:ubiquinone/menaquinone biosynthesis C-methylase UbiE